MTYQSHQIGLLASAGSVALLGGAWIFQALGYAPCAMCIWQRYPHAAAILIGLLVLFGLRRGLVYLIGALAAAMTASIGVYHTGVERDWWQGPTSCTGSGLDMSTMSAESLLSTSEPSNLVMCDQVAWALAGLSMASWNAVFSLILGGLWLMAFFGRIKTAGDTDLTI